MGAHGPLRDPNSVRGLREADKAPAELPTPESPVPPTWLKARVRKIFDQLVTEAVNGGVPTKACDGHMFAMAAQCTLDYQQAKDAAARARIGRDLEKFYDVIGATPKARLRMGIKGKPAKSKTSQLLELVAK